MFFKSNLIIFIWRLKTKQQICCRLSIFVLVEAKNFKRRNIDFLSFFSLLNAEEQNVKKYSFWFHFVFHSLVKALWETISLSTSNAQKHLLEPLKHHGTHFHSFFILNSVKCKPRKVQLHSFMHSFSFDFIEEHTLVPLTDETSLCCASN